jgi:heat shock protein HtpX
MKAFGLQTHIWSNNFKSVALLLGFPLLLAILIFALYLLVVGFTGQSGTIAGAIPEALDMLSRSWPIALLIAGGWFVIAGLFHQKMIEGATGSKGLTRKENPDLYNMLENLCIERGLSMPRLNVIESPMLNAFASGISDKTYTITLTRGIIDRLNKNELRAVMAHELTHIMNRDVRLLIVAVIFVGIFSFVGEIVFRNLFRAGIRTAGYSRGRKGDSRGGGAIILVALALIALTYVLSLVVRFAISRRREFLADAGAVDLTRDPDAMIGALQKISGNSKLEAPDDVAQMFIDNSQPFLGMFMTHPPIEKRIQALVDYAGGIAR